MENKHMPYVDGFVLALPAANLEAYREMSEKAGKVWMEHGALAYRECIADDTKADGHVSFPELAQAKEDEIAVFSYIVYESREHRDAVLAKTMNDPRLKDGCEKEDLPFDWKRMAYGGFQVLVDL